MYGYARSRRVIWFGLAMNVLATLTFALVAALPESADSPTKGAFGVVFAFAPRILLASTAAFFVGEFLNSYVLARLKLLTGGKWLWTRTIGSTLIGQGADTLVFSLVAFWGVLPSDVLWGLVLFNYVYKVGLEVVLTPVTYAVVAFLKRAEGMDAFDRQTDFNPFRLGQLKPQPRRQTPNSVTCCSGFDLEAGGLCLRLSSSPAPDTTWRCP